MPLSKHPCGDDACSPLSPSSTFIANLSLPLLLSLTPFFLLFTLLTTLSHHYLFPRLSAFRNPRSARTLDFELDNAEAYYLPADAPPSLKQAHEEHVKKNPGWRSRVAGWVFAVTMGLAGCLGALILAEVGGDSTQGSGGGARDGLLRVVVLPTLLFLLVGVIPFLEILSVLSAFGFRFSRSGGGRAARKDGFSRFAWMTQFLVFDAWLFTFWSIIGRAIPREGIGADRAESAWSALLWTGDAAFWDRDLLARGCLERIGVIGISLMALLSGFASVSTPWQTLTESTSRRKRPITEADVARKQAGLDATNELLLTKTHRLRSLQRKMSLTAGSSPSNGGGGGVVGKMFTSIKGLSGGNTDANEVRALRLEISGLETMSSSLSTGFTFIRSRLYAQTRAATTMGKFLSVPAYLFSAYCVYRILATTLTSVRRLAAHHFPSVETKISSSTSQHPQPTTAFSSSDPINRFLSLLAKHWDPSLDQLTWSRQISFLLSGLILLLSANSVLTTFHLFARYTPGLLHQAQANLALLTAQISATYVISAALLLRGNLPREGGEAVGNALESALDGGFVDRWFEGWFLLASCATAVGIWVGGKLAGDDRGKGGREYWWDEWDDLGGEEMGTKRS